MKLGKIYEYVTDMNNSINMFNPLSIYFFYFLSYQSLFQFVGEPVLSSDDGWLQITPRNGVLFSPTVFHITVGDVFDLSVW
jgi:hypothetical protein